MNQNPAISSKDLQDFRRDFEENSVSRIAERAVSKTSIQDVCYDPSCAKLMNHKFSIDLDTMDACNQKSSGRCWIFAAMNLLREPIKKNLNLEGFELSQSYICFYDHLEKANTFLEQILSTGNQPLEDRYVSRLLSDPIGDGGWWEYFVGLVLKYGLVPKEVMPETHQSSSTGTMNTLLSMQLRKDALTLRKEMADGNTAQELRPRKAAMLSRIYNVLAVCLGEPPKAFDFEYVDRDGTYHADRNLTPAEFYEKYIGRNLREIISIMNAPVPQVPYYKTCYTEGEESICGAFHSKRLNLPMEEFKAAVIRQLEAGEPVWFVCDCDYYGDKAQGIWDTGLYDYESLLGLDLSLSKGDLLQLRQCSLNHAMLLTGVNLKDGKPDKWKVQNSWGTEDGKKGYFILSDAWFDRYVYTASIVRTYLTEEENRLFDQEPLVLPPWNVLA